MDFYWNGDQLAEEIPVSADGKPEDENAIRWIYEPGSFTPLARYEKGQLHYAVTDTVGRIQELLTEEGTIVWRGKQQLWGKEEGRNQEDAPSCHLRFPGQYEDDESGLFYNRFRYYDGESGQYVSPDPIGLRSGLRPYGYVSNPLKWIDPLGLACCPPKYPSRNAALRDAKRDAGIPMGQQPSKVEIVNLTDRNGHNILGKDYKPIKTREYTFTRPDQTRPDQTRPDQTRPDQTRPDQRKKILLYKIILLVMFMAQKALLEIKGHILMSDLRVTPETVILMAHKTLPILGENHETMDRLSC
ncbi:Uncharacterized conserved protein [Hafnia alvei]|nr:RHS repeat-associated core domain-containing protein [Hafnia alvei]STR05632.1 Uncharacterized conserved protein [Hafnia alvei]